MWRLLSRKHLDASTAQVDRWVNSGALEVATLDRRPRFRLAELNRFASVHSERKGDALIDEALNRERDRSAAALRGLIWIPV